jgi:hypothetical protein
VKAAFAPKPQKKRPAQPKPAMIRKRLQGRDRMRQLRERAKKHRRDPLRYFHVPLPESVIHQIVAELRVSAVSDVPVDDRTWHRLVGLVIARVVRLAVSKNQ